METFRQAIVEAIENIEGMEKVEEYKYFVIYQYRISSVRWIEFTVYTNDEIYYCIRTFDDKILSNGTLPLRTFYDIFIASNRLSKVVSDDFLFIYTIKFNA